MIRHVIVLRRPNRMIGPAVADAIEGLPKGATVLAVVPQLLAYFADMPTRYEVTEAILIYNDGRP